MILSKLLISVFLIFSLLAAGCAGDQDMGSLPPEELFGLAKEEIEDYHFEEAQMFLDRIREQYPFSSFAVEAELLAADMAYEQDEYEQAAEEYLIFERIHPTHERVDYAIYRQGLCHLELSDTEDRDLTGARNAVGAFAKLLNGYPSSEFARDAGEKLVETKNMLAEHELYVADFYFRKERFEAARERLRTLVREYPDSKFVEEATRLALEIETEINRLKAEGEAENEDE